MLTISLIVFTDQLQGHVPKWDTPNPIPIRTTQLTTGQHFYLLYFKIAFFAETAPVTTH